MTYVLLLSAVHLGGLIKIRINVCLQIISNNFYFLGPSLSCLRRTYWYIIFFCIHYYNDMFDNLISVYTSVDPFGEIKILTYYILLYG